jgi:glucokinase
MTAPLLVADVGGTRVRFAVCAPGGAPLDTKVLAVADFPGIAEAALSYLAGLGQRPLRGAIAVAGPVSGDFFAMTNHTWSFSTEAVRRALNLESLVLVNDFEANALAIPHLTSADVVQWGGGTAVQRAPCGILGPGTGLGVASLVWGGSRWVPVPGEGGHADFAVGSDDELLILHSLTARFGHVSLERILSGPGLVHLFEVFATKLGLPLAREATPADVAAAALRGDSAAVAAVRAFSGILGAAAGNLALTLGARGGVYVAGGVVGNLGAAFDRAVFRARFEDKGRFASYLAQIPTFHIVHPFPALLGLAHAALEGN